MSLFPFLVRNIDAFMEKYRPISELSLPVHQGRYTNGE